MTIKLSLAKRITFLLCALFWALPLQAQLPDAPVILDFGPGGCNPVPEVCGDGLDQDCDGGDLPCTNAFGDPEAGSSSVDADADGYRSDVDCNDTDKKIYPGIYSTCAAADDSTGTRVCQSNGSYSACSTQPLCEAVGSGTCYYVSKLTGNDANPGTFAAPLKTLRRLNTYNCPTGGAPGCTGDPQPANVIRPKAGDVIYLMGGVYDEVVTYGFFKNVLYIAYLQGTEAAPLKIKAYPGAHPIISPGSNAFGITIHQSKHALIEGIEINQAYGIGLWLADGSDFEVRNMWIHHIDGVDNDNVAGFTATKVENVFLHHSLIHDNYDRTAADTGGKKTENSRNLVMFGGGNHRYAYNTIFQTPPTTADLTGGCIAYKHDMTVPGATYEVDHNIFRNCYFTAVGTGTYNGLLHHNVIYDSDMGFMLRNFGSADVTLVNNRIEFNTLINTPALNYDIPDWEGNPRIDFGEVVFRRNITLDNHNYNTDRGGIVSVDIYGNDTTYNRYMSEASLQLSENCYFNSSQPTQFCFSCATSSGPLGVIGGLSSAQNLGLENASLVTDPQLSAQGLPGNASCQSKGHYAQ